MTTKNNYSVPEKKSEFSMGQFFFIRFNRFHEAMDESGYLVRCGKIQEIKNYYAALYGYYINILPLLSENETKYVENLISYYKKYYDLKKEMLGKIQIDSRAVDILEKLHKYLLGLTNKYELGIVTSRKVTNAEKIANVFGASDGKTKKH